MKKLAFIIFFFFLSVSINPAYSYISNWDFNLQYGFLDNYTPSDGVDGRSPNTDYNNKHTRLEWGTPAGDSSEKSSIFVDNYSIQDTITTNSPSKTQGASLWHENYPIFAPSLKTATLSSTLKLRPSGSSWISSSREFSINFFETPNPAGDIFMITGFKNFSFDLDLDQTYTVKFEVEGFQDITRQLSDSEKDELGLNQNDKAWGFITPESKAKEFKTSFSITSPATNPVPEPGTLILLGLGLLIIAFLGKKKIIQ